MDLGRFLKQRDIIYTLCAAALSTQIVLIADLITTSFIVPVINKTNHKPTIAVENFTVDLKGAKIEVGKFLIAIIRLLIIIVILYLIYQCTC